MLSVVHFLFHFFLNCYIIHYYYVHVLTDLRCLFVLLHLSICVSIEMKVQLEFGKSYVLLLEKSSFTYS